MLLGTGHLIRVLLLWLRPILQAGHLGKGGIMHALLLASSRRLLRLLECLKGRACIGISIGRVACFLHIISYSVVWLG